jgi:putative transposase
MFWYVMLMLLSPLYLMFGLVFRGEQARLVLALHHQVLVLQRQLGKRPSLVPVERLALVLSSLLLGKEKLREALLIVKPETLVGWHRAIVRRHWRLLSRRKAGRPPEITPETERLVLRIARENSWMGYGKIAGEMRKLGYMRFGRSSVARILEKHGLTPERRHDCGLGWLQFLAHYGQFIWASDFATVTTATLRTYYLVFFLEVGTRRIIHWNVSTSPDEVWVSQQFRNLSVVSDDLPRYLIHDRDSKYTLHADSLLEDVGTKVIRLPVRSPDLNGYAERWIRSLRQECLDRLTHHARVTVITGESYRQRHRKKEVKPTAKPTSKP